MGSRSDAVARHHSSIIVCIARSKCLTYIHLLTNIAIALTSFIISLVPGQLTIIDEADANNWEETCTNEEENVYN